MTLFPKGAFGRTAIFSAGLLLLNLLAYILVTAFFVVKPNNEMLMKQIVNEINMLRLLDQRSVDLNLLREIQKETDIQWYNIHDALDLGLNLAEPYDNLSEAFSEYFNGEAKVRVEHTDKIYYWVNHPDYPNIWFRILIIPIDYRVYLTPVIYVLTIFVLSVLGGWLLARQLHRPLKRLEVAAKVIGRGEYPERLEHHGASEVIQVTQAFNQMVRNIRRLEEDRSLLLAGISHDLRTPITRIRLAAEFLQAADEETQQGIIADTEDMEAIIEQFIAFVRDGQDDEKVEVDLNEIILQIVGVQQLHQRSIETDLLPLPSYQVKPLGIKRVIDNLIENAFRYGKPPVLIQSRTELDTIVISIIDQGAGIPESEIDQLFEPFVRGEKARTDSGSGLGLSIVKRIMEMHDGRIEMRHLKQHDHSTSGFEVRLIFPL